MKSFSKSSISIEFSVSIQIRYFHEHGNQSIISNTKKAEIEISFLCSSQIRILMLFRFIYLFIQFIKLLIN